MYTWKNKKVYRERVYVGKVIGKNKGRWKIREKSGK